MGIQIASVKSNMRFVVNYETMELEPVVELIILSYKPEYRVKGDDIIKATALDEIRLELPSAALDNLIGKLQLVATQLQGIAQAGGAINSILKEMQKNPNE